MPAADSLTLRGGGADLMAAGLLTKPHMSMIH